RQGEDLPRQALAPGVAPGPQSQVRVRLRPMDRNRVVHSEADAAFLQCLSDGGPVVVPDHVQVIYVVLSWTQRGRRAELRIAQQLTVASGDPSPGGVPGIEVAELDAQHGRLQRVKA